MLGKVKEEKFQKAIIVAVFLGISSLFLMNVFSSDYGTHLAIGRYIVENKQFPDLEFLNYPNIGKKGHFPEQVFQIIIYLVYRFSGSSGVSILIWLLSLLTFFTLYKALRVRDIHPFIILGTLLFFAIPFRMRLQPRPEIFSYVFTAIFIYILNVFYYRGNRRIIYLLPVIMLLWSNIHPSVIVGLALIGAYGTESLKRFLIEKRRSRGDLMHLILIPLIIYALTIIASGLSRYGFSSVLAPFRMVENKMMTTYIAELNPIKLSTFYPYYRYILGAALFATALGILSRRVKLHDLIIGIYGIRLPLRIARGIALMAIFTIPMVAQSIDGFLKAIGAYRKSPTEMDENSMEAVKEVETRAGGRADKARDRKGIFFAELNHFVKNSHGLRRVAFAVSMIATVYFLVVFVFGGAVMIWKTKDFLPAGVGMTEHRFSFKSAKFLRELDIKGNMFNHFDLGGFLNWQLYPEKLTFIDGRSGGSGPIFEEHILVRDASPWMETIFAKYDVTYVVTKATDQAGRVIPYIGYLVKSNDWEIVFSDGLFLIFVKNIPENRGIIDKYKISKDVIIDHLILEYLHDIYVGVSKFRAYKMVGSLYLDKRDFANAKKYYLMALKYREDPELRELLRFMETGHGGKNHR